MSPPGFRVAVGAPRPRDFSIHLAVVAAIPCSRDYVRSFVCLAQSDFISAGAGLRLAKDFLTSRSRSISARPRAASQLSRDIPPPAASSLAREFQAPFLQTRV